MPSAVKYDIHRVQSPDVDSTAELASTSRTAVPTPFSERTCPTVRRPSPIYVGGTQTGYQ